MFEIGLQMFSFYDMERESLEKCIRTAAEIGYPKIELAGLFDLDAERIKEICDELGIRVCSTHSGMKYLTPDVFEQTVKNHKILNCSNLTIPHWKIGTAEEREGLIDTIKRIQPVLSENGIKLHYHNHSPEFMFEEGAYWFCDMLCERTDIDLQIDVYHVFAAGLDPVEVMKHYDGRISSVHIRDGLGYQLDARALGEGKCPVLKCVDYALEHNFEMIVENASWVPDAVSEAKKCLDYLKANYDK